MNQPFNFTFCYKNKKKEIEEYQAAKNDGKEAEWELNKYLLL